MMVNLIKSLFDRLKQGKGLKIVEIWNLSCNKNWVLRNLENLKRLIARTE